MNVFEFMSDSPIVTVFIAFYICQVIIYVCFRLPRQAMRSRTIQMHGWPPEYLNADGDFEEKKK